MNKIASQKINKEFDGFEFEFDVWFDKMNNEWWFAYADVYTSIDFSRKAAERHYYNIDENDKHNFLDTNFMNEYGEIFNAERSFINYNALMNLLDRNKRKVNAFAKVINNIVLYTDIKLNDSELEKAICELGDSFKNNDLEGVVEGAKNVARRSSGRPNALDDNSILIEQTNDQRQELIDAFDDGRLVSYVIEEKNELEYDENIIMTKKENIKQISYRRVSKGETTCPDWLKDVIK